MVLHWPKFLILPLKSEYSRIVESPSESLRESMIFVTTALPDRNQILVACTYEKVAYLFDVNTGAWVPFDSNVDFGAVVGKTAVVLKTTMCWYDDSLNLPARGL